MPAVRPAMANARAAKGDWQETGKWRPSVDETENYVSAGAL